METIPNYLSDGKDVKNYYASLLNLKPSFSWNVIKGIAKVEEFFKFIYIFNNYIPTDSKKNYLFTIIYKFSIFNLYQIY